MIAYLFEDMSFKMYASGPAMFVFFGNYFYGVCAVALCIEASLQQGYPLNSWLFYVFIFSLTVLYYTKAYITEKKTGSENPRSRWYWDNRRFVFLSQVVLTVIAAVYPLNLLLNHLNAILTLPAVVWLMLLVFPVSAALYYGTGHPFVSRYRLRNIGWLKPFLIGFVWAGLVTVYPFVMVHLENKRVFTPEWPAAYLFIKNFMFVTVLCIMFDIKDYAADHNRQLKTFVVKAGLRKTLFVILLPLCVLGLGSYILYGSARSFSLERILVNTIPFLLLMVVTYSMHRRKSIFYYLVVIDGLMLVKALCGSIGAIL